MSIKCDCKHNAMVILYKCHEDRTEWKCKGCDKLISVQLDPNKKCETTNCENLARDLHSWDEGKYCYSCVKKTDEQFDSIRDTKRLNMQQYGNEYGLIDTDEYWGRKPY